jgi:HlyD family secretion protein
MDHLSNELNKLKIDKTQRRDFATPRRSKAPWIVALLAVLLAGVVVAYPLLRDAEAVEVTTVRPRTESAGRSAVLVATGYVVPHHKIQVGSKIAGRVAWIGVDKGDRVVSGQVIVRLEDREYRAQFDQAQASYEAAVARLTELERGSRQEEVERARSEVRRAEAQLRTDESVFKRIENLVREEVAAAQTLDEARGRYETSRAALESARHTLELTEKGPRIEQIDNARSEVARAKAAVDYARTILDSTQIRVPTSGTILERNVEQGEMITTSFVGDRGAKSFVVTLADLNDIQVELDISQNDFNRIVSGQRCTAVTDAFPDRSYDCIVDEIAPEANRQKATVQVKVKFLKPDEFVKPEMNARVTFLGDEEQPETGEKEGLFIIPRTALIDRENGKAVFAVTSEGIIQAKPVTVAREAGSEAFISSGLTGSEAIVTGEPVRTLKAGDRVVTRQ